VRIDFAAVRERHPLATVAQRTGYPIADGSGDVFVGCPMPDHDDRTPSMLLHLEDGRYHCFGCGASGDVVQWVRDIYRVDARGAVELLDSTSERFPPPPGGPVSTERTEIRRQHRSEQPDLERTPSDRVLAALGEAWRFYSLPRLAERASEYLADRPDGAIDTTGLGVVAGHTPYNPDQLVTYLRRRGFGDDELVDAGLARRREGEPVRDAYIRRVVVPVRDEQDRVIGLIGRTTAGEDARVAAKYLNSATTVVYDKSQALYDPVRGDLAQDGQVVVVEGVMDALAIAAAAGAAGLGNRFRPVATSGVAFSDTQIDRILAMHPRAPVIALDGDQAGQRAAAQLAVGMARRGRETTITTWPRGEDPASWLGKHGPGALSAVTRQGCLDAHPGELRPHHGGREVAAELMAAAGATLEAKVSAALEPAGTMPPTAAERYTAAAAHAIAPEVVAAAASVSGENRGRVNHVIETVVSYGARLPPAAEGPYVAAAVQSIEALELAPGMWAEREITGGLENVRSGAPIREPRGEDRGERPARVHGGVEERGERAEERDPVPAVALGAGRAAGSHDAREGAEEPDGRAVPTNVTTEARRPADQPPGMTLEAVREVIGAERCRQLDELMSAARLEVAYGRVSERELRDHAARLPDVERAFDGRLSAKVTALEQEMQVCDTQRSEAAERELDLYEQLSDLRWWQRAERAEILTAADAERDHVQRVGRQAAEIADELAALSGQVGHPDRWMTKHARPFAQALVASDELARERPPPGPAADARELASREHHRTGLDRDMGLEIAL
jgi:DNA primase